MYYNQYYGINSKRSLTELEKLDDQFYLEPDGLLATGRGLDREVFQYYIVEIRSCDGGKPAKYVVLVPLVEIS